jgi:hypothetical protein
MARIELIVSSLWLVATSCGSVNHDSVHRDGGAATPSTTQGSEAGSCFIKASNYDQSCSVDSDCTGVAGKFPIQSGNYCQTICLCGGDSINKKAIAQYVQDVSMTPAGAGAVSSLCFCGMIAQPCCKNGTCTTSCPPPMPTNDGEATPDAEGIPGSVMCDLNVGPFDAGAAAPGPWRWCVPPTRCVPFNGGWACCGNPSPPNGPTICSAPLVTDASTE